MLLSTASRTRIISETEPDSYQTDTGASSIEIKQLGREADHLRPAGAQDKYG
jgi:hypothetical protein